MRNYTVYYRYKMTGHGDFRLDVRAENERHAREIGERKLDLRVYEICYVRENIVVS